MIVQKMIESEKVSLRDIQILRLFANTLTANDKYSLLNRENSTEPIQIRLSQKQQSFSQLCIKFLKFTLNFEHF